MIMKTRVPQHPPSTAHKQFRSFQMALVKEHALNHIGIPIMVESISLNPGILEGLGLETKKDSAKSLPGS